MTTPRRIICLILSLVALSSCNLFQDGLQQRIVRIKALADPGFRARNPRWAEELRGRIEAASDYFEREFDIRLVTQSTAAWPEQDRVASTANLIVKLKQDFPAQKSDGAYDLIVAFAAEAPSRYLMAGRPRVDRIGDCQQGLSKYLVMTVEKVFRYTGPNADLEYETVALIHELGHVFGAEHVQDTLSIMHESFGYRAEFDMKNRSVILKNRTCPFAK